MHKLGFINNEILITMLLHNCTDDRPQINFFFDALVILCCAELAGYTQVEFQNMYYSRINREIQVLTQNFGKRNFGTKLNRSARSF